MFFSKPPAKLSANQVADIKSKARNQVLTGNLTPAEKRRIQLIVADAESNQAANDDSNEEFPGMFG